jgi:hypothetical protein
MHKIDKYMKITLKEIRIFNRFGLVFGSKSESEEIGL